MRTLDLYIDGRFRPGAGGRRPVIDPATEQAVAEHAVAGPADLDAALVAAERALSVWGSTLAADRAGVLLRTAAILRGRTPDLARELSEETGKTLAEATGEIGRAVEHFDWFAGEAMRISGEAAVARQPGQQRLILPEPVGVVLAVTAWNFPAVLVARKLSAALAAGCPVILKAAEEAPSIAVRVVEALAEAGLPPGVVNLVLGDAAAITAHLLASPVVRKLTFTGSSAVGRILAEAAAGDLKRCTFELGGHAPVIVCPDADLDKVVASTIPYKFTSAGQSCVAPSRFYVHASRYAECLDRFTAAARGIVVGNGREPGVRMGALTTRRRLEAMERLTADAVAQGARLVLGGKRIGGTGFFFAPTVLAEVPEAAQVMSEEPFGPIAPFAAYEDLEDAIARANRLRYGFTAYAFTGSLKTASELATRLKAGNVGINQMCPSLPDVPIGGVDHSGYGYEGGSVGLDEFLHYRLISQSFG